MARALSFAQGTLNPHNFLYPTFYFYVLFAWVGVYLGLRLADRARGDRSRRCSSCTSPIRPASTPPGGCWAPSCGTVTVRVRLPSRAARLADGRIALAAAVFLAVAPLARPRLALRQARRPGDAGDRDRAIWRSSRDLAARRASDATAGRARRLVAGAACGVGVLDALLLHLPGAAADVGDRAGGWRRGAATRARGISAPRRWSSAVVFFALSPFLLVEPMTACATSRRTAQIVVDRAVAERRVRAGARAMLRCCGSMPLGRPVVAARRWSARSGCSVVGARARASCCWRFPVAVPRSSSPTPRRRAAISTRCCRSWSLFAAWALASAGRADAGAGTAVSGSSLAARCARPRWRPACGPTCSSGTDDTRTLAEQLHRRRTSRPGRRF